MGRTDQESVYICPGGGGVWGRWSFGSLEWGSGFQFRIWGAPGTQCIEMRIDTFAVSSMNCVTGTALEKVSSTPTQRKLTTMLCTERGVLRMSQENKKKHSILVWGYQAGPENISRRFRSTEMIPSVFIQAVGGWMLDDSTREQGAHAIF